jgi:hypothetical protein
MTPDVATLLQRLLQAGESVLTLRDPGDMSEIIAHVEQWLARPTDRARVVHPYTLMAARASDLAAIAKRRGTEDHATYCRVVGLLLPDVRKDCWEAFQQRNRPTP